MPSFSTFICTFELMSCQEHGKNQYLTNCMQHGFCWNFNTTNNKRRSSFKILFSLPLSHIMKFSEFFRHGEEVQSTLSNRKWVNSLKHSGRQTPDGESDVFNSTEWDHHLHSHHDHETLLEVRTLHQNTCWGVPQRWKPVLLSQETAALVINQPPPREQVTGSTTHLKVGEKRRRWGATAGASASFSVGRQIPSRAALPTDFYCPTCKFPDLRPRPRPRPRARPVSHDDELRQTV